MNINFKELNPKHDPKPELRKTLMKMLEEVENGEIVSIAAACGTKENEMLLVLSEVESYYLSIGGLEALKLELLCEQN